MINFNFLFVSLLSSILMGYFSHKLAKKRGRNPKIWFFLGFMFGIFAIITLVILPIKIYKKVYIKDNSSIDAKEDSFFSKKAFSENLWYYLVSDQQKGPVSFAFLKNKWIDGEINQSTYVWSEDLKNWTKIKELINQKTTFAEEL